MPERAQRRAERIARRRQPILVSHTVIGPASSLDDPLALQLAQPRDQHRARDQGHAAMDVAESARPRRQLAQDKRCPAVGKDLASLGDWTELAIGRLHVASEPAFRLPGQFEKQTSRLRPYL